MLTRLVATLALCLLLAVAPADGTPAVADAGCVGQSSWPAAWASPVRTLPAELSAR